MKRRTALPLVEPGSVVRMLAEPDVARLVAAWLDVFGRRGNVREINDFMWQAFGGGGYPSASGDAAMTAYEARETPEYLVVSNDRKTAFVTDQRPVRANLLDFCVVPANLAWTMCFTHEIGWIGPYFATHPDFDRLDAANLAQMRKRREAEVARTKGWC